MERFLNAISEVYEYAYNDSLLAVFLIGICDKGPIISKILPLNFDDKFGPIILNIKKIMITIKN